MATPTANAMIFQPEPQAELEEQLREAEEDLARALLVDLTLEELDHCIAQADWPS